MHEKTPPILVVKNIALPCFEKKACSCEAFKPLVFENFNFNKFYRYALHLLALSLEAVILNFIQHRFVEKGYFVR